MEKIVYDYLSRKDIVESSMIDALEYIYSKSYPKPEKTYIEMCKDLANMKGTEEYDKLRNAGYPYSFYYIPRKVLEAIWDNRKEANGIEDHWHDNMDFLIKSMFETRAVKEVYEPTTWSKEPVKHCVDQKLLNEIISEEDSQKVKKYLEEFRYTYKFGRREIMQAAWLFSSTPNVNRESVISVWKECFNKDIEIPSDDTWIDIYEYEEESESREDIE